jgi:DNA-binding response OmpR family regulator
VTPFVLAELPIIVVTGQVLREAEAEVLDAGATVLLRKPLDLGELAAAFSANLRAG